MNTSRSRKCCGVLSVPLLHKHGRLGAHLSTKTLISSNINSTLQQGIILISGMIRSLTCSISFECVPHWATLRVHKTLLLISGVILFFLWKNHFGPRTRRTKACNVERPGFWSQLSQLSCVTLDNSNNLSELGYFNCKGRIWTVSATTI